jgi:mRNA interferase MazF
MVYRRGDTVLVPFPFSDLTTTKVRPAIVISSALYHREEPDLLLAGITTKVISAIGSLDYVLKDWKPAGLRFPFCF